MDFYEMIVNSFKEVKARLKNDPTTNTNVSGYLAAELTLIVSLILLAIMLRHVNVILTIVLILALGLVLITNMPLMPKFAKEQDDSLNKMIFYVVLTLAILVTILYWGRINV
ncbi:hypothetical protein [Methanobrevibacter filiformis]|uniref:Hydrogenase subunit EhbG n=1 Tax=Methanobrevibacter filiformis TaxID=55758 RepID=A0A166C0C0_9EURY|nr:hypothetical protein [Methanobrevibacter filiformis]KZX13999.1 hypothetical protein MBFIL_09640 [Methanobrevibacter filiformis]